MNGDEAAAELHHFGTAYRRLEPLSVMKGGIPIVDGCMVSPKGDLKVIVVLKADNASLDLRIESGGGRRTCSGVSARGQAQFPQKAHFRREIGNEVQNELSIG